MFSMFFRDFCQFSRSTSALHSLYKGCCWAFTRPNEKKGKGAIVNWYRQMKKATFVFDSKKAEVKTCFSTQSSDVKIWTVQVILFETDCTIFYTNLHVLFCQFISWTNWVNSGKLLDNCWILCQVMADMKKVYDYLIIINL